MRRKRQLLTREDCTDPVNTLLEALDNGEDQIFIRRASNEQLESWWIILNKECERLKASIAQNPDLIRLKIRYDELDAERAKAWGKLQDLERDLGTGSYKPIISRRRRNPPQSEPPQLSPELQDKLDELKREYQRVLDEVLDQQALINRHPDSSRLIYVDGLRVEIGEESDRRADDDEEDD